MGADANVSIYDFKAVDEYHRKVLRPRYSRGLDVSQIRDYLWRSRWYRHTSKQRYILDYWNTECEGHSTLNEYTCVDEAACKRVMATLEAVDIVDRAEVWT